MIRPPYSSLGNKNFYINVEEVSFLTKRFYTLKFDECASDKVEKAVSSV